MNNPDMADIDERYKTKVVTKRKPSGNQKTTKNKLARNSFKRNMPKRLRKEWGQRVNHLRSIV